MTDIYGYIREREPGKAGITFFRFARRQYIRRALLLLFALPVDLAWTVFCMLARFGRKTNGHAILLLTSVHPAFAASMDRRAIVWVGAPHNAWSFIRRGGSYLPAAPLYILVTLGLYLPATWQAMVGRAAVALFKLQLRLLGIVHGAVIHHSDALPFARAVVLAARSKSFTTVCLQHGLFHATSSITERDGYLSDINVVRSRLDADLIRLAAPQSTYLIEPDFFLPTAARHVDRSAHHITLIGEGWFQCDEAFNAQYMARLRALESSLIALHFDVVFRPHPSERKRASEFGFRHLDLGTLQECLARTSLVIGYSSTLLYEAASLGVRAAQIEVDGVFNPSMDRDDIRITRIQSADDVRSMLQVSQHAAAVDQTSIDVRQQQAAQRIWQALLQAMERGAA